MSQQTIELARVTGRGYEADGVTPPLALSVFRFTPGDQGSPLDKQTYERRVTTLKRPDGTVSWTNAEVGGFLVPEQWSVLAGDIAAEKYARKAGCTLLSGGRESSVRDIVQRVSEKIGEWGIQNGYFFSDANGENFKHELQRICVEQYGAFNSPVWFNCGLDLYGCTGSGGNWRWRTCTITPCKEGAVFAREENYVASAVQTENAYTYPQCSACFILSRQDDLDDLFNGIRTEARLFKHGSGAGSNFSGIRSRWERLSGGGKSSGLMTFLTVFDRGAGSLKSGGTTRRAAKMVVLNADHPEVLDFIGWKAREEKKAKTLIENGYPDDTMEGEAYMTVSGQNSNNSVCISDQFMYELSQGTQGLWSTRLVTTGEVHETFPAEKLWRAIAVNTWECGDPGIHFGDTINAWHTCPNSGRINSSNPCSEYLFLDDTACNLASLNLLKYIKYRIKSIDNTGTHSEPYFDIELFQHDCRIMFIAQEILVGLSSYPTAKVAENSHKYRPLGLGHCNGGLMLMTLGIPYDSDEGRALMGAITSLMTATAYHTSTMLAQVKGPFEGYEANKAPFMAVMEKHTNAASALEDRVSLIFNKVEDATHRLINPVALKARQTWSSVLHDGALYGFRNAQATVLAPTGTIGFLMGAETTGVEPLYCIVMRKSYAGGTKRTIVADGAMYVLTQLLQHKEGWSAERIAGVVSYLLEEDAEGNLLHPYVEGSGLPEKYWPIFATAGGGKNEIPWKAHVEMMAAVQPFLSGAISKTINMPNSATVEDIEAAYLLAYNKGLKAVAIFRDGSKWAQPLTTGKNVRNEVVDLRAALGEAGIPMPLLMAGYDRDHRAFEFKNEPGDRRYKVSAAAMRELLSQHGELLPGLFEHDDQVSALRGIDFGVPGSDKTVLTVHNLPPEKRKIAQKSRADQYKLRIAGQALFVHVGLDDSGKPLSVFVRGWKMGGTIPSLVDAWCIGISTALQYGAPLSEIVNDGTFVKFEPAGSVQGHSSIKMCSSIIDLVARILGYEYLNMKELGHIDEEEVPPTPMLTADGVGTLVATPKKATGLSEMLNKPLLKHNHPLCDQCGHITEPNGRCHRCPNCGNSMGCS